MSGRQSTLRGFFETSPERPAKPKPTARAHSQVIDVDDEPPKKRLKTASSSEPAQKAAKPSTSHATTNPTRSSFFEESDEDSASVRKTAKPKVPPARAKSTTSKVGAAGTKKSKASSSQSVAEPDQEDTPGAIASGTVSDDEDGIAVDTADVGEISAFLHPPPSVTTNQIGPSGLTYTPLEQQVVQFKARYPDLLLLFEVGYKYRSYGADARIAAQALGHVCFKYRNFLTASFPTVSLVRHVKKLLYLGHKVGVIGQAETAALKKAGENRNKLFERKLLHLWTAATFVDDLDSVDNAESSHNASPPSILCVVEKAASTSSDSRVTVGIVSVVPSTGDIVYDEFQDTHIRTELETRLAYIKPWELLIPSTGLSKLTEDMLKFVNAYSFQSQTRVERFDKTLEYSAAFEVLSKADTNAGSLIVATVDLPRQVVIALAHVFQYLQQFHLERVLLQMKSFHRFSDSSHMLLNASTLANLEVFRNQTTLSKKGSLYGVLDRTETKFGSRLMKEWIGRPLVNREKLQERLCAIEEISNPSQNGQVIDTLRDVLGRFSSKAHDYPDLAKGLAKIQHGKCTPQELGRILSAFRRIANVFKPFGENGPGLRSTLLNQIVVSLPSIQTLIEGHTEDFSFDAASKGNIGDLWKSEEKYPKVADRNAGIAGVWLDLQDELKSMRKVLRRPALQYKDMSGQLAEEFVVELEKDVIVPDDWALISRTKKFSRYRSPVSQNLLFQMEQHRELLKTEAEAAFKDFQAAIANDYVPLRNIVNQLAIADCLVALAHISLEPGYCQPQFVDDNVLTIVEGRHPVLDLLRDDPFIPNSLDLGGSHPSCKVITGPNMGGKSSFVRMVALIVIMAQVGSYLPADSATLGIHDALLARMGANDELMQGRSTFMVEMTETSEIIKCASRNSLVILDELGRGTSTFDGMAIASAVLEHLATETGCKVLFITHYPHVATSLAERLPSQISIAHMAFVEKDTFGMKTIHFLYQLRDGLAASFGIECGRLAGLPEELLESAAVRAGVLQSQVDGRVEANKWRRAAQEMHTLLSVSDPGTSAQHLHALQALLRQ